jgi:type VI secretion system secreted protein VgrG
VILAGGAQAANIYWQVGSSATLGVSSVFKGTIMALASITANNGASVEGRLLARTAAVTLDNNLVKVAVASNPPVDITAPVVSSATPWSGATGVAVGSTVTARFSEAMSAPSINAATFSLKQGLTPMSGTGELCQRGGDLQPRGEHGAADLVHGDGHHRSH